MKRKLIYLFAVAATAAAAFPQSAEFPRFLLVFELLFLLVMAVLVRIFARRIELSMELSKQVMTRGSCVEVQLFVKNPTAFPTGEIRAEITVRDVSGWQPGAQDAPQKHAAQRMAGRQPDAQDDRKKHAAQRMAERQAGRQCAQKNMTVSMDAGRRSRDCWTTKISPVHCGLLEITVDSVWVSDYMGVCRKKLRGPFAVRHVSVLPRIYPVQQGTDLRQSGAREGWQDEIAARAGSDTQEIFDTRIYQRGDTLRKIHWKLSAKTDELMVKEFSMPTDEAVRIAADTGGAVTGISAETMDRFLENTAAFAALCLEQGYPCELLWYQADERKICSRRFEREEEMHGALEELLGVRPCDDSESALLFEDVQEDDEQGIWRLRLDGTAEQGGRSMTVKLEGRDG